MDRVSFLELLGFPDKIGETILIILIILIAAPYAAGSDFGIVKIPDFGVAAKKKLRIFAPLAFLCATVLFIPVIPKASGENIALKTPFGKRDILLNGQDILVSDISLEDKTPNSFISQKFQFRIAIPDKEADFRHELISAEEYARKIAARSSMSAELEEFSEHMMIATVPFLKNAAVFRVFRPLPYKIETDKESYIGPRASPEEYNEAKSFHSAGLVQGFTAVREIAKKREAAEKTEEFESKPGLRSSDFPPIKMKDPAEELTAEEMLSMLENLVDNLSVRGQVNIFNELSILIVDRLEFEKTLIASNQGRAIKANPLIFLLSAGGTLPRFDPLSVIEASISSNNRVWGFYGKTQYGNVFVDGRRENNVYFDFYRLYAINSAYIYQITLSYIPGLNHPRTTWDNLVKALSTFRIVAQEQQ